MSDSYPNRTNARGIWNISELNDVFFGTRGMWYGGGTSPESNVIDYINILSTGNATDFGDLTTLKYQCCASGSKTRAIISGGGNDPGTPVSDVIEYVTFLTTGNGADFGDLTEARRRSGALSSNTRGIVSGGSTSGYSDILDYITTASLGNAIDFGNNLSAARYLGACSSPTRGVTHEGYYSPGASQVLLKLHQQVMLQTLEICLQRVINQDVVLQTHVGYLQEVIH